MCKIDDKAIIVLMSKYRIIVSLMIRTLIALKDIHHFSVLFII